MKKVLSVLIICFLGLTVFSQETPAPAQSKSILILNAKAHLGTGKVIENSAIGFVDGKITVVTDATINPPNSGEWDKVIDATGKDIYPGFIAPNTQLGLVEIGAVRATRDSREVGGFNPNVRSIISYNTDSRVTPTVRANGVLTAQIVPAKAGGCPVRRVSCSWMPGIGRMLPTKPTRGYTCIGLACTHAPAGGLHPDRLRRMTITVNKWRRLSVISTRQKLTQKAALNRKILNLRR